MPPSSLSRPSSTALSVAVDPPPPNPPGTIDATTFRISCSVRAYFGACCLGSGSPSTKNQSLRSNLILLSRGIVSSYDILMSLDDVQEPTLGAGPDGTAFSFPLPRPEAVSALLQQPVAYILGMCTPQD
jgi:hypothetical protein